MKRRTHGVGYNSGGKHRVNAENGVGRTCAYNTWRSMLERCYCKKSLLKRPTYSDVIVCEEWHDYQNFAEWFTSQRYCGLGYNLDKDILIVNNKIYSPNGCCLIPQEINKLLNGYAKGRGELPLGVCFKKRSKKYCATVGIDGTKKHIGYFHSKEEAHSAYIIAKTENIKRVANKWFGKIDDNVYLALSNWDFSERSSETKWGLI